jgi:hypothetical protein
MRKNKKIISVIMKKPLILALGLVTTAPLFAQFTVDGEIRPRFEYRHGFSALADSAQPNAAFVDQRTRLNFGYKTEGYIFKVTLQNVHVWGSQPQLISNQAQQNLNGSYLSIHEAWGEALISENWSLKFGRQEISIDNDRIFGSVGWAQQARSHDAALLKFNKKKFKADIGIAYNQDNASTIGTEASKGSYKAFQYLWLHNDFGENFGASVLFLNNGKEQLDIDSNIFLGPSPTAATDAMYYKDNYSQTIGTYLTYKKNKLAVEGAFYTQMGLAGNRTSALNDYNGDFDREVSAINYSLDLKYKITEKFTAGLGYEFMSGHSQTDTSAAYNRIDHAFTPFYGTNHKFNGHMDHFYVGNWSTFGKTNVGLQDIYINAKYTAEKYWVEAAVHLFSATADVWDGYKYNNEDAAATITLNNELTAATNQTEIDAANSKYDAFTSKKYTDYTMAAGLGTEIDLSFGFNLSKGVAFKGGYSMMVGTETLAYLQGVKYDAPNQNAGQGRTDQNSSWGWAMIIFKPNFTEKKDKKAVE